MKKKNLSRFTLKASIVAGIYLIIFSIGCNSNQTSSRFSSDADSIAFVNQILSSVNVKKGIVINFSDKNKFGEDRMERISWEEVTTYADAWVRDSLILDRDKKVVRGFRIDKRGLKWIMDSMNVKKYDEVYLRFGKKGPEDYTVMVLPMMRDTLVQARRRNVITLPNGRTNNDNENYDHLDPCPTSCPPNFPGENR